MPRVSIIIPTFNYGRYITNAVDSVLSQNFQSVEIIVVDDGSIDSTKAIIDRNYKNKVRYLFQENSGASAARNRGLKNSQGEYLIFLDADDALGHDQILSFVKCSEKHPGHIIYGPWLRYSEGDKEYKGIISEKFAGVDMLDGWLRGWYIASCCILWPRNVLEHLGGWDETLFANQDGDIAMRALIEGYDFYYCHCAHALVMAHSKQFLSVGNNSSLESLYSRLSVFMKIENMLCERNLIRKYRKALSEGYYCLGFFHVRNYPDFSKLCYWHFRRLRGLGKPPGSILNWVFVSILGLVNKEKLSYHVHHIFSKLISRS